MLSKTCSFEFSLSLTNGNLQQYYILVLLQVFIGPLIFFFSPKKTRRWGASAVQGVKCPTSAQVMISWVVSLNPTSGSVLTAQNLELILESVSLSAPPLFTLCFSVSKINIKKMFLNKKAMKKEINLNTTEPPWHPRRKQITIKKFKKIIFERQSARRGAGVEREGDPESEAGPRL